MSIAEKLTAIAENEQKVYDAGYAAGQAAGGGEDLFAYATNINNLFANSPNSFPDGYELTLDIPYFVGGAEGTFSGAKGIKKVTLKGNVNNSAANLRYFCLNSPTLEEIDFTEFGDGVVRVANGQSAFDAPKIHTIKGVLDLSGASVISGVVGGSIVNVTFKPLTIKKDFSLKWSNNLSDETIQSILDGLADLTGGTAQTLTLHATVGAKLTEAQKAAVTSKNWTLVY